MTKKANNSQIMKLIARGAGKSSQIRVLVLAWVIVTGNRGLRLAISQIATQMIGTKGDKKIRIPKRSLMMSCDIAALALPIAKPMARSSGSGKDWSARRS